MQEGVNMRWLGVIATTIALFAAIAGVPCLFAGLFGLIGILADTSAEENRQAGLMFLGLAVLAFTPLVIALRHYRVI